MKNYDEFCEELLNDVLGSKRFKDMDGKYIFHCKGEQAYDGDKELSSFILSSNIRYFKSENTVLMGDFIELYYETEEKNKKFARCYVPALYDIYIETGVDGVWEDIENNINQLKEISGSVSEVINLLSSYKNIKDRLIIRPLNYNNNSVELKNTVYTLCGDIALVLYAIVIDDREKDILSTVKIPVDIANDWNVDIDMIMEEAMVNTNSISMPRMYTSIADAVNNPSDKGIFMADNSDVKYLDDKAKNGSPMVTTTKRLNGAVAMFYPGVQEKISELVEGDYYVAFTSIHEAMIHKSGTVSPENIQRTLREVNEHFGPDETLTENVFKFECETRVFRPIAV